MNRIELQQLAEMRVRDAEALLAAGRWSAAYYLAGYAIECGLKACIAKLTNQHDFPRDRKFVEECYTHELEKLVKSAGLKADLDATTGLFLKTGGQSGVQARTVQGLALGAHWQRKL